MSWEKLGFAELGEAMNTKRAELAEIFQKYDDVAAIPADDAERIKPLNDELTAMGERYDSLKALDEAREQQAEHERKAKEAVNRPGTPTGGGKKEAFTDIGQAFVESDAFKAYAERKQMNVPFEVPLGLLHKDVLGTDSSLAAVDTQYAVQNIRLPGILTPLEERNVIASLFPQGTTSQQAIPFMQEKATDLDNATTAVLEAGLKPESAMGFEEVSSPVRKLATWMPVTEEAFADVPAMRAYVTNRLRGFIESYEDDSLLNGTGIAPELTGILNISGIQTQAKGADPTPDAIHKAMTLIATNAFLTADGVIMNPLDWEQIRLLRTADGIYIWGSPADPGVARIWGLGVTQTTRLAANTAIVGAFRDSAMIFRREGVNLRVADQHSDFAIYNKLALIVEERLAFVPFRPAGFCTVTGI